MKLNERLVAKELIFLVGDLKEYVDESFSMGDSDPCVFEEHLIRIKQTVDIALNYLAQD